MMTSEDRDFSTDSPPANDLYCVTIMGQDSIIAMPDYFTAMAAAEIFNEWWSEHIRKTGGLRLHDPLMWAIPTIWPQDERSVLAHAKDLERADNEYEWLRVKAVERLQQRSRLS